MINAGVVATAALWRLGFIAYVAGTLPVIIYGAQRKAAETRNAHQLRR